MSTQYQYQTGMPSKASGSAFEQAQSAFAASRAVLDERRFLQIAHTINTAPQFSLSTALDYLTNFPYQPWKISLSSSTGPNAIVTARVILSQPAPHFQHRTAIAFATKLSCTVSHGGGNEFLSYDNAANTFNYLIQGRQNHAGFAKLDVEVPLWFDDKREEREVKMRWDMKERKRFLLNLIPSQVGSFATINNMNWGKTSSRRHERVAPVPTSRQTEAPAQPRTTGPGRTTFLDPITMEQIPIRFTPEHHHPKYPSPEIQPATTARTQYPAPASSISTPSLVTGSTISSTNSLPLHYTGPEQTPVLAPSPIRRISPVWIRSDDIGFPFPDMLEPGFGEVIGQADHGTSSDGASGRGAQVPQREYQSSPHDFQTNEIGFPFPNMFERNLGQMVEQAIHGRYRDSSHGGGAQVPQREHQIFPHGLQTNDTGSPFPRILEWHLGHIIERAIRGRFRESSNGGGVHVPEREHQISPHSFQPNDIGSPFPNMFERNLGQMVEQAIQGRSLGFTNRGGVQVSERDNLPSNGTVPEVAAPGIDHDLDIDEIIEQYRIRHPEFAGRGEVSVPERAAEVEAEDQIDRSPLGSTERNEIPAPRSQREEAVPSVTSPDFAHRCEVQPVRPVRDDSQFDTSFPGLAEAGFDIASDSEEESQSDGTAPESTTRDEAPAHQGDARETRRKNVRKASIQLEFGIERVEDEGYVGGDEEDEARPLRWERSSVKLEFGEERVEDEGYVGDEEDVEDVDE